MVFRSPPTVLRNIKVMYESDPSYLFKQGRATGIELGMYTTKSHGDALAKNYLHDYWLIICCFLVLIVQKIVIEVQLRSRRRRAKAMKIADGVNPVAFNEEKKDQMVIIGDGIDAATVALSPRKKVGHATLVTVEEIVLEDI